MLLYFVGEAVFECWKLIVKNFRIYKCCRVSDANLMYWDAIFKITGKIEGVNYQYLEYIIKKSHNERIT